MSFLFDHKAKPLPPSKFLMVVCNQFCPRTPFTWPHAATLGWEMRWTENSLLQKPFLQVQGEVVNPGIYQNCNIKLQITKLYNQPEAYIAPVFWLRLCLEKNNHDPCSGICQKLVHCCVSFCSKEDDTWPEIASYGMMNIQIINNIVVYANGGQTEATYR